MNESLSQQEWPELLERAGQEEKTRPARLERMRSLVSELFPGAQFEGVRSEIERSFHVPQWGEYHNEGIFMDRHFEEILETLARVEVGDIPTDISPADRLFMQQTAIRYHDALQKYVFLHDISKADALRIEMLPAPGEKKGVAWEGTLEQWHEEWDVSEQEQTNPRALYTALEGAGLKGFSYYHQGIDMPKVGRKTEATQHGEAGKNKLEALGDLGIDGAILNAIERHEVAFQFQAVNTGTYVKYFEPLAPEERALALIASYIDTAASWRKGGAPDLENFRALLDSKINHELIQSVEQAVSPADLLRGLDKKKVDAFLSNLRKQNKRLQETRDNLLIRLMRECRPTEYVVEVLRSRLDERVAASEFTQAEADEIFLLVQENNMVALGKKYGKNMRTLTVIMKASEKMI